MQFCLGDRPLEAQAETIGIVSRVVDAVGIGDQRARQRAQVQQPVPVGVRPSQPRHLDRQDDAHVAEANLGGQPSEAGAVSSPRARKAQVLVDDHYGLSGPAQLDGSCYQVVLAGGGLPVPLDLHVRTLANVNHTEPGAMLIGQLGSVTHCSSSGAVQLSPAPA